MLTKLKIKGDFKMRKLTIEQAWEIAINIVGHGNGYSQSISRDQVIFEDSFDCEYKDCDSCCDCGQKFNREAGEATYKEGYTFTVCNNCAPSEDCGFSFNNEDVACICEDENHEEYYYTAEEMEEFAKTW